MTPIEQKIKELEDANVFLGINPQSMNGRDGGEIVKYSECMIIYHSALGAYYLPHPFDVAYTNSGGTYESQLGYPVSDPKTDSNTNVTTIYFQFGKMVSSFGELELIFDQVSYADTKSAGEETENSIEDICYPETSFEEEICKPESDVSTNEPIANDPKFVLINIDTKPNKQHLLSNSVTESFNDAAKIVFSATQVDLRYDLGDSWRPLSLATEKVGADNLSNHKTGRAFDLCQSNNYLIIKDGDDDRMVFRLYLKYNPIESAEIIGNIVPTTLDETIKKRIYRNALGNIKYNKYNNSGDLVSEGTKLFDVTKVLLNYGFERIQAWKGWDTYIDKNGKKSDAKTEWWHYQKMGDLNYYNALREIYIDEQIINGLSRFAKIEKYKSRLSMNGFPQIVIDKMLNK